MFLVGNFAFNQRTEQFGKVIGYGHQTLNNNVYQMTLKAMIVDAKGIVDQIEEDLYSAWKKLEDSIEM
jgi:hypothetical protein